MLVMKWDQNILWKISLKNKINKELQNHIVGYIHDRFNHIVSCIFVSLTYVTNFIEDYNTLSSEL